MDNQMGVHHSSCNIFQALFRFWKYIFNYKRYTSRAEFWGAKAWQYGIIVLLLVAGLFYTQKTSAEFVGFCLLPKISAAKTIMRTNPFILAIVVFLAVLYIPSLALRTRRLLDAGLKPTEAYLIVALRPFFAILVYFDVPGFLYYALWIACIVIELMPTGMEVMRQMQAQFQYYASYQPNYGQLSLSYRPKAKHKYYIAPTYNYNNYYSNYHNNGYLGNSHNNNNRLKK